MGLRGRRASRPEEGIRPRGPACGRRRRWTTRNSRRGRRTRRETWLPSSAFSKVLQGGGSCTSGPLALLGETERCQRGVKPQRERVEAPDGQDPDLRTGSPTAFDPGPTSEALDEGRREEHQLARHAGRQGGPRGRSGAPGEAQVQVVGPADRQAVGAGRSGPGPGWAAGQEDHHHVTAASGAREKYAGIQEVDGWRTATGESKRSDLLTGGGQGGSLHSRGPVRAGVVEQGGEDALADSGWWCRNREEEAGWVRWAKRCRTRGPRRRPGNEGRKQVVGRSCGGGRLSSREVGVQLVAGPLPPRTGPRAES